ncbi:MAG: universal stress protein [Candidatus Tectomicrobia bacterium]|nr:universal stress protein [Candidatus Tectomicrobia bacterium]
MEAKKILVPIDFSEYSEGVLNYALTMLENSQGGLILFHVLSKAFEVYTVDMESAESPFLARAGEAGIGEGGLTYHDLTRKEIRRDLTEEARIKLIDLIPVALQKQVEIEVRVGEPYEEILNFVQEQKIDMIVMGTHGRTGLAHLFLGSVAERVVRHSPVPVVTISPLYKSAVKK